MKKMNILLIVAMMMLVGCGNSKIPQSETDNITENQSITEFEENTVNYIEANTEVDMNIEPIAETEYGDYLNYTPVDTSKFINPEISFGCGAKIQMPCTVQDLVDNGFKFAEIKDYQYENEPLYKIIENRSSELIQYYESVDMVYESENENDLPVLVTVIAETCSGDSELELSKCIIKNISYMFNAGKKDSFNIFGIGTGSTYSEVIEALGTPTYAEAATEDSRYGQIIYDGDTYSDTRCKIHFQLYNNVVEHFNYDDYRNDEILISELQTRNISDK